MTEKKHLLLYSWQLTATITSNSDTIKLPDLNINFAIKM